MVRPLHRWAGILAAVLLISVSLTGTVLSVYPALTSNGSTARLDAGALVSAVETNVPGVQQISVAPTGAVTASGFGPNGMINTLIDPTTGAALGPDKLSGFELWVADFHRALFLGSNGRLMVIAATAAMLVLTLAGYVLAARRMGGWRQLFSRDRGAGAGSLHLRVARIAGIGLILSSATGLMMAAATWGILPDTAPNPAYPMQVSTSAPLPADQIAALNAIPGDSLRSISVPAKDMPGDAYFVETDAGAGYVDPGTGKMLSWADRGALAKAMDMVRMLHTGQGAALLGLLLGLAALAVPLLSGSGVLVWLAGRVKRHRHHGVAPDAADVVILVGSEGGSTWGFAESFAKGLARAGKQAHTAALSDFAPERYDNAEAVVVFAATYGDGDAPGSAKGFLARLEALETPPVPPLAVLGFGDSAFPSFCAYADEVTRTAKAKGWTLMVEPGKVDGQSIHDFHHWVAAFSRAVGIELGDVGADLHPHRTSQLTLVSRRDFGAAAQAPTSILRFALPKRTLGQRLTGRGFGAFEAGDLVNIVPEGDTRARPYSLASSSRDGFVEIVVRRQPGGLCSGWLTALEPGATVPAWTTPNPNFRVTPGKTPLLLIGAGAGVGALAGFARANRRHRPLHLYTGIRSRAGGFPYEVEFSDWKGEGRLTRHRLALSQGQRPHYVQEALTEDADRVAELIAGGARVMVCGGRGMAEGVRGALSAILASSGRTLDALISEGRYVEDVF